tara:strand:- start:3 stop:470 length:468 start_codon:yes stop_codon:yes gene_type:complete
MFGPFGSPVFSRAMFQQQNIMDPGFTRMLQIRDAMRRGQPVMMEGNTDITDMGTLLADTPQRLEALPGDESFGQLGEAQQETQLGQVQQAVNQMQENQQALADHLGAGSRMASNQRQVGLAGLLQPQPSRLISSRLQPNVRLQQTLGPESLMRYI